MAKILLVCLDFDGTIMAYDEETGHLHPQVIATLNKLSLLGVAWCTNSGREMENQRSILDASRKKGLKHMPTALLCGESFIYRLREGSYVSSEPWNSAVRGHLKVFHQQVQSVLKPHMEDWKSRYQPTVYAAEEYTTFLVGDEEEKPARLCDELQRCMAGAVPRGVVSRNGGWLVILPSHLGKGNVLRTYIGGVGFSPEDVLSVGDHFNDISMLDGAVVRHVGCPADAIPEVAQAVRNAGGWVASAKGPAGTVEVIEHFLAGGLG